MSRQSTVLYTPLYCIILRTLSHSCFCAGLHGHRREERRVRLGGEGRGGERRNVLDIMKWYLLSACTKRNPHVVVFKPNRGEGENECSSTETLLFLDSQSHKKVSKFDVSGPFFFFLFLFFFFSFSTNSTFFFSFSSVL